MSRLIVLDTGPLGMVTNPTQKDPKTQQCSAWLQRILLSGNDVAVPEIADYELRRELIRAHKPESITRLDELKNGVVYLPITTDAMIMAARLWAQMRNQGTPTAPGDALDGDMILAAQAVTAAAGYDEMIVATTNIGHLSRVTTACEWSTIQ
ncbi:type II toxin-antitoxin system VapC family toxin [Candidatus Poribacteria bacterium]|nr:type II toxin-antitoxin system VapC family toxin [Candidatus Poribacteria bacterium]